LSFEVAGLASKQRHMGSRQSNRRRQAVADNGRTCRRRFQHKCVCACEQGWALQKFSSEPEQ
jgi:hypothetical protein